jgi:hypothetical protein
MKGIKMKTLCQWLLVAAVCIAVAGCASGVKYSDAKASISPVKSDMGRIYFYRTSAFGGAIQPDVNLNDQVVGKAVPEGIYYVDKAPGEYKVRTSTEVKRTLSFVLDPGQTKYVRFDVSMGFFMGHVSPVLVEEDKAKVEIEKCKLIK